MERKRGKAKAFLSEMKKSLSQVTFEQIVTALQSYKTSDSLETLLSKMAVLTEDANTHGLFRGGSLVMSQDRIVSRLALLRETEEEELGIRINLHAQARFSPSERLPGGPEHMLPLTPAPSLRDVPVCPATSQEAV